jgi:AcrR family transcriptional regulator
MIVKEAGVAKGTFYLYYKNKQELYEYIIFHILDVAK